jgi:branched-subunit amino acid transport protein
MMAWIVIALAGIGTLGLRSAVPVLVGGRELPAGFDRVTRHVSPAMLGALSGAIVSPLAAGGADPVLVAAVAVGGVAAHRTRRSGPAMAAGLVVAVAAHLGGL